MILHEGVMSRSIMVYMLFVLLDQRHVSLCIAEVQHYFSIISVYFAICGENEEMTQPLLPDV